MGNHFNRAGHIRKNDRNVIANAAGVLVPAAGWSASLVGEGLRARVYRIDWVGRDGRTGCMAARVCADGQSLLREHTVCRDVLPVLGVRAPRILGFFEQEGVYASIREYLSGVPPWEAKRPDFKKALDLMAAYHQCDVASAPAEWTTLCNDYRPDRLAGAFAELVRVVSSADRQGSGLGWLTRSFIHLAESLAPRASDVVQAIMQSRPSFVHGDAVPGNFLFGQSGEDPVLVDWDQFGVYVPHIDVLSALYHHDDEERHPLIAGYLETSRRLSGRREDPNDFHRVLDLTDLQRSAEIVALWLGRVLVRDVDEARVAGFIGRRVRAIEAVSRRLGFIGA